MSNITFSFSHVLPILNGTAKLTITESSFVLSEKSLYGAGSTMFESVSTIEYTNKHKSSVILFERSNRNKQNVLDLDSDRSLEEQAEELIIETLSDALFSAEDD